MTLELIGHWSSYLHGILITTPGCAIVHYAACVRLVTEVDIRAAL